VRKGKSKRSRYALKKSTRPKFLLIVMALILLSCVYIWQRVITITLSARTKELRLEISEKQETLKYLQIEVTRLSSVPRIEERGKEMGLVYPQLDQIGFLRESSDSTYLETSGSPGNFWTKLRKLQREILSPDEALAKEPEHEP
jgi:cell division protein FtsL